MCVEHSFFSLSREEFFFFEVGILEVDRVFLRIEGWWQFGGQAVEKVNGLWPK